MLDVFQYYLFGEILVCVSFVSYGYEFHKIESSLIIRFSYTLPSSLFKKVEGVVP